MYNHKLLVLTLGLLFVAAVVASSEVKDVHSDSKLDQHPEKHLHKDAAHDDDDDDDEEDDHSQGQPKDSHLGEEVAQEEATSETPPEASETTHRPRHSQKLVNLLYGGQPPVDEPNQKRPETGLSPDELRRHPIHHQLSDKDTMELEVSEFVKSQDTYDKNFNYGDEKQMTVGNKEHKESRMNQLRHKLSPRKLFRRMKKHDKSKSS